MRNIWIRLRLSHFHFFLIISGLIASLCFFASATCCASRSQTKIEFLTQLYITHKSSRGSANGTIIQLHVHVVNYFRLKSFALLLVTWLLHFYKKKMRFYIVHFFMYKNVDVQWQSSQFRCWSTVEKRPHQFLSPLYSSCIQRKIVTYNVLWHPLLRWVPLQLPQILLYLILVIFCFNVQSYNMLYFCLPAHGGTC